MHVRFMPDACQTHLVHVIEMQDGDFTTLLPHVHDFRHDVFGLRQVESCYKPWHDVPVTG